MSPNNGSVLTLNDAARTSVDVWLDGSYTVLLKNVIGATIRTTDNVIDWQAATAYAVPNPASGTDGQVIATDGTDYGLIDIRQMPDPTGHAGQQPGTDGTLIFWEAKQTIPTYDTDNLPGGITAVATKIQVGDQVLIKGTDTCPTSGTTSSTKSVTFGYTFASPPACWCIPTIGPVTGESARCSMQALAASTTGFTASAFAGAEDGGGSLNISVAVPFNWFAWGTAPAAP
ncbi:MAG: hypothetical protein V4527_18785 [Pseudomonadota bacterium]